jgi:hypothetical protein
MKHGKMQNRASAESIVAHGFLIRVESVFHPWLILGKTEFILNASVPPANNSVDGNEANVGAVFPWDTNHLSEKGYATCSN